ncbi:MAG: NAD-dependent deacylase [Myxococcales bacterium]|nr:MAG: NAD-dependent deacylase [Myxococcales bacterium]
MTDNAIREAAELIFRARSTVALSGAGISVDSGIPDFRSPGGLWERFDPMDYAHISSFMENPARVWRMLDEIHDVVLKAKPNPGHQALAELEAMGRLDAVITQNIDNLHQEAGSKQVIEFHGNSKRLVCLSCLFSYPSEKVTFKPGKPPRCVCGAILKPDIVFFGEAIPPFAYHRALELAGHAEAMLVVGTSAQVAPSNMLPGITRANGGTIIEVNVGSTSLTAMPNVFHLNGSASEMLPRLVREVRRIAAEGA